MFGEVFNNEIKLKEDECCIVFDFGCYYPYEDADHLFFDFEFDGQIFNDKVINHRYPNKSYQTITKINRTRPLTEILFMMFRSSNRELYKLKEGKVNKAWVTVKRNVH